MITYLYKCEGCKKEFEESYNIEDRYLPTTLPCPSCGEYSVQKGVSYGGFQLRGGCWSKDNYARCVGDDPRGHFSTQTEGVK